ncbi:hypothetical protein VMCG_08952 [Cytospora schulzeri]|uniref:Major facilitator superfamily (MFS) profile domain-containing protein n=1 Tax=Cytospora schulzeri TaxID=448051 RepID=A0A423VNS4_9PEZI|nr:hypothetical protein VMCG_08952 [Valsa malicola]
MESDANSDRTKVPTTANSVYEKKADQVDQPVAQSEYSTGPNDDVQVNKEANQSYNEAPQSMVAAQASLPLADTAIGTSLMMFGQMFGGSLFVSVAENVFTNKLLKGLATVTDLGMTPQDVVNAGATELKNLFGDDPGLLREVKYEYNEAVMWTFRTALIMSCLSVLGVVFVEWRSVKGRKIEMMAA